MEQTERPTEQIPLHKVANNQRGIAMLLAIFSVIVMIFLVVEVQFDSAVEYTVASQQVNRIKAYYAAKAGVEISLLRILVYKKLMAQFGEQLGANARMLDPIWQFPFAWPPIMPDETSTVDKSLVKDIVKKSTMDSQYIVTIDSEGGKIDINDLGSPSKGLRDSTKKQILQIFQRRMEDDDDFSREHGATNFEELVHNMMDWVDEDLESLNGGDEKAPYRDEMQNDFIPPNQPFRTLQELHMVADMKDEFFDMLRDKVTVHGTKGVNVNYATAAVLMSIDRIIDKEMAAKIIARRQNPEEGGPFQSVETFENFVGGGDKFNENGIPLLVDPEFNFRIRATGQSGNSVREIIAVTYDLDGLVDHFIKILDKDEEDGGAKPEEPADGGSGAGAGDAEGDKPEKKEIKIPKGRPAIVYWSET